LVAGLGAVPDTAQRKPFDLSGVTPVDVTLPSGGVFRMFVDARQCDLPGYRDCPVGTEIDFPVTPGRSELVLPVSELVGRITEVRVHPIVCMPGQGCPEENSDPALCPGGEGCHELAFRIEDMSPGPKTTQRIVGDGTALGTTIGPARATSAAWWLGPVSRMGPAQDEETAQIRRVIEELRSRH
jgi:hypothetical protein